MGTTLADITDQPLLYKPDIGRIASRPRATCEPKRNFVSYLYATNTKSACERAISIQRKLP
ncbi:hypothetical protein GCM10008098_04580 [Rhodanobacter panaciterrae]|uniref:RES domain-containing protein n=1 Tax=Rhodanobacter panaciterrae TaxID=490572 RepID=A0ABQ2ZIN1_9GAMM|nr:hypothetical protein GCM10008098_04580 [Rhodanobacter panaciterrae]